MAKRRSAPSSRPSGDFPPELATRVHPIWRDIDALLEHPELGRYVDDHVVRRIRMGSRPHQTVRDRWALDHGYESSKNPGFVDEHRLRADMETAGLGVDDDSRGVSGNGRMILPPGERERWSR